MTKSQVRRYIKEMENKRAKAQLELEKAKLNGELDESDDLDLLEDQINTL
jgi:hypothetical protein